MAQDAGVLVTIEQGQVRGTREAHGAVFRGIPFAEAPTGSRRFAPPVARARWDGVLDASRFGPTAPQPQLPPPANAFGATHPNGEDCLNLNVWTPDVGAGGLPVMVWIHGGAFTMGAGSDAFYDGAPFARDGVVFVSVNYRLGAEGFLHLDGSTGSPGLADQLAALEWVQANIAHFGGDPANVTIFGESAGGMSVSSLMAMPAARGLFRRAIPQSGAGHAAVSIDDAVASRTRLAGLLGITGTRAEDWRSVPLDVLLKAQAELTADLTGNTGEGGDRIAMHFAPVHGTDAMPARPIDAIAAGSADGVDLLIGTTAEEGLLFAFIAPALFSPERVAGLAEPLFAASGRSGADVVATYASARPGASDVSVASAVITDHMFRIPAIRMAEARARRDPNVWMYEFAFRSPHLGACHAIEIPFVFDCLGLPLAQFLTGPGAPAELARVTHEAWVTFAKTGRPGANGLPAWPAYDADRRAVMRLDTAPAVADDPAADERRLWDGVI